MTNNNSKVKGRDAYCNMIRDLSGAKDRTKQTADYLEATVFSKDRAVIMIGNFADVKTEADKKKVKLEILSKTN